MAAEANMTAPSKAIIIMGYGPHTLHLTREEQLLNIQNKILVSKTSIYVSATHICALHYIK